MKELRDEIALVVLTEALRNAVMSARIVSEGKKADVNAQDALAG